MLGVRFKDAEMRLDESELRLERDGESIRKIPIESIERFKYKQVERSGEFEVRINWSGTWRIVLRVQDSDEGVGQRLREASERLKHVLEIKRARTELHRSRISFGLARYLGGLPDTSPVTAKNGLLVLSDWGIGLSHSEGRVPWERCNGLTVDGGQVAKRKLAAALTFGILGAVTAKGSKDQAVVSVWRDDGASEYFLIDKMSPHQVRAKLAPELHRLGVPFLDQPQGAGPPIEQDPRSSSLSVAEQIREFAQLRDDGLITSEEYEAKKAQLLG
jgi:hypothetical protein